jgi:hypothetical protein
LAEAGVKKVVVFPHLETSFGKEVGEVLLEILVELLKSGPRFRV